MKKTKIALAIAAAVVFLGCVGVLVAHWRRPMWFTKSLVKGLVRQSSMRGGVVVVAIDDPTVEHPEQPTDPMQIQKADGTVLAHENDVDQIVVTGTHVFYSLRGMLRPKPSIRVVSLEGGSPRELGTAEGFVTLAAADDRVWWLTPDGNVYTATATDNNNATQVPLRDRVRCIASGQKNVLAATRREIFTLQGTAPPRSDATIDLELEQCSMREREGTITFAHWTANDGAISTVMGTHWKTVVASARPPIVLGDPGRVVWVEGNQRASMLVDGKPKQLFEYDPIRWADFDDQNRLLIQTHEGDLVRVIF